MIRKGFPGKTLVFGLAGPVSVIGLALPFAAAPALASAFNMGVATTIPDAQNAQVNPALAGALERTEISASPTISIQNNLLLRYPDSGTIEKQMGLLGDASSFIPGFVYKLSPRLGIGVSEILPPIKLNQKISGVPIVILNSTQQIDIDAAVKVHGGLGGVIGYRFSDYVSLGVKANYRSVTIDANVVPEGGGDPLAVQHQDTTTFNVLGGILLEPIPGRLRIGLSTLVLGSNSSSTSVESAFVAQKNPGADDGRGQSAATASGTFSQFIAGGALLRSPRRFVAADIDYKAASNAGTKEFSMVDFKEKPVDSYARVDFHLTGEWSISRTASVVGGYALENASKGPGSRSSVNDAGKAGFGSGDVIQIYTGQASLVPAYSFMGGIKLYMLNEPRRERADLDAKKDGKMDFKKKNHPAIPVTPANEEPTGWILGAGIGYRKASLGIDKDGELPGAYQQTRIYLPIEITRRF